MSKDKMKTSHIKCDFKPLKYATSDILVPVKIRLLHDGENRNYSSIGLDAIKDAAESIKNKPILAYIDRDADFVAKDFAGHEISLMIDNNGELKTHFMEFPVGVIPESTMIDFEEINGKTYMTCLGYIYKDYSNETIALIEATSGKCVSVEIDVLDGNYTDENILDIKKFSFQGVTILGDSYTPGMDENCTINFFSANVDKEIIEAREKFMAKIKEDLKKQFEEGKVDGEGNPKEPEEPTQEPSPEEPKNPSDDEPKGDEPKNDTGGEGDPEPKDEPKNDNNQGNNNEPVDFSIFNSIFGKTPNTLIEVRDLYEEKIKTLENENEELKTFKANILKEQTEEKVETLLTELDLTNNEIIECYKEKVFKDELSYEEFEKEVYAFIGRNIKKQNFDKKDDRNIQLDVYSKKDTVKHCDNYNGILNNILGY